MKADSPLWIIMGPSATPAEEAALNAFRELLPDDGIATAWVNLTFIDNNGRSGEIDVLLLTRAGLFNIELKGWHGKISGTSQRWTHNLRNLENPWIAADRKAKRLAEVLKQVAPNDNARRQLPFLQSAVVLHGHGSTVDLDERARTGVLTLDGYDVKASPALPKASHFAAELPTNQHHVVDWQRAKAIRALCEGAGFRAAPKIRMVGDYQVADSTPIAEGPDWQDVLVDNPHLEGVKLRLRLRDLPPKSPASERQRIEQLAQREYQLTYGIRHDGVDVPTEFKKTDDGPALVFEYDEAEQPLDGFIDAAPDLSFDERIGLIFRLGEIIRYAHQRHLIHRALAPRHIWVRPGKGTDSGPRLSIRDWYTGQRDRTSQAETRWTTISAGVTDLLGVAGHEDWIYLAPEARVPSESLPGVPLDVYGFGAVAYLILTGRPPAKTLADLEQKLIREKSLDPRAAVAGIPDEVAEVISAATSLSETQRPETIADLLDLLQDAWDHIRQGTEPAEPVTVEDPLDAQPGDALSDRFLVIGKRGEGSSGVALAVNDTDAADVDREVILKVARVPGADKRLRAEAEVLRALDHKRIVHLLEEPIEIGGRLALLLSDAGKETLAVRLAKEGRSTLGQLQHLGGDLLDAMAYLETKGLFHRDIKPANLGITPDPGTRKPALMLFDFSLAQEPVESIDSGTHGYLDPSIGAGVRKRYDRAAELYAVSATLFEMATGSLPWWADGGGQPLNPKDSPVIEPTAFEPAVSLQLTQLFRKALHPDAKTRFSSADELAVAWHEVFESLDAADETTAANDSLARTATLETALERSGLSARARSALTRLDIATVGDLLGVHPSRINTIRGLGETFRKEIQARIREWRDRLSSTYAQADAGSDPHRGVERVVAGLLDELSGADRVVLESIFGLSERAADAQPAWPAAAEVAQWLGQTREQLVGVVDRAVISWANKPELEKVRDEVVTVLAREGRVMTMQSLALALAAQRGSLLDGMERTRYSAALLRAAYEFDARANEPTMDLRRSAKRSTLIALHERSDPDQTGRDFPLADVLIEAATELGRAADKLVGMVTVVPYAVAAKALRDEIADLEPSTLLTDERRIVRLAADVSETAAVSGFDELYPQLLAAQTAVELVLSGKPGRRISEAAVRKSVATRFPRVKLPASGHGLDALVMAALPGVKRHGDIYEPASTRTASATGTSTMTMLASGPTPEAGPKLHRSILRHGALTLCVPPKRYIKTARALESDFELNVLDVSGLVVEATKRVAAQHGIEWPFVVGVDAGTQTGTDWANLTHLVQQAVEPVWAEQVATDRPLLVVNAGPLHRYGLGRLLAHLLDVGTDRPAARWLLVAMHASQPVPMLEGKPVPVGPSGWISLPADLTPLAPQLSPEESPHQ